MKAKPMRFAVARWVGSSLLASDDTNQQAARLKLFNFYSPDGAYNAEFPANCSYLWKAHLRLPVCGFRRIFHSDGEAMMLMMTVFSLAERNQ